MVNFLNKKQLKRSFIAFSLWAYPLQLTFTEQKLTDSSKVNFNSSLFYPIRSFAIKERIFSDSKISEDELSFITKSLELRNYDNDSCTTVVFILYKYCKAFDSLSSLGIALNAFGTANNLPQAKLLTIVESLKEQILPPIEVQLQMKEFIKLKGIMRVEDNLIAMQIVDELLNKPNDLNADYFMNFLCTNTGMIDYTSLKLCTVTLPLSSVSHIVDRAISPSIYTDYKTARLIQPTLLSLQLKDVDSFMGSLNKRYSLLPDKNGLITMSTSGSNAIARRTIRELKTYKSFLKQSQNYQKSFNKTNFFLNESTEKLISHEGLQWLLYFEEESVVERLLSNYLNLSMPCVHYKHTNLSTLLSGWIKLNIIEERKPVFFGEVKALLRKNAKKRAPIHQLNAIYLLINFAENKDIDLLVQCVKSKHSFDWEWMANKSESTNLLALFATDALKSIKTTKSHQALELLKNEGFLSEEFQLLPQK